MSKTTAGLHVTNFSKKVRTMSSSQSKSLTLTAEEAKNLHFEIFEILAQNIELNRLMNTTQMVESPNTIEVIGGSFKSKK